LYRSNAAAARAFLEAFDGMTQLPKSDKHIDLLMPDAVASPGAGCSDRMVLHQKQELGRVQTELTTVLSKFEQFRAQAMETLVGYSELADLYEELEVKYKLLKRMDYTAFQQFKKDDEARRNKTKDDMIKRLQGEVDKLQETHVPADYLRQEVNKRQQAETDRDESQREVQHQKKLKSRHIQQKAVFKQASESTGTPYRFIFIFVYIIKLTYGQKCS
jgi:hypothetical protein